MSKYRIICIAVTASYLLLASCSKKQAEEIKPDVPGIPGTQVTFTNFVQPLFQTKCASCHATGSPQAAIWNFNGYSTVTANSDRIIQQVIVTRAMPLIGSLSESELQSLKNWFDQGMPQ